MKMRASLLPILLATGLSGFLAGCSELGLDSDASYSDKQHEDLYKYGSVASDKGGINLFGDDDKKAHENGGIGVNGYLWRATLDTVSFMPIASADPFGGVVLTDWYNPPETPNERTKLNIFIRGRDLRADGVKVSIFRQQKDGADWVDAPVAASTAAALENAILTKARQIRLAQKQQQTQ